MIRGLVTGAIILLLVVALLPADADKSRSPRCFRRQENLGASTTGDDILIGRVGRDVIHGRRGADGILGLSGNDRLCGGRGDDRLNGGDGFDRLDGGRGYDVCNVGERVRHCEEF